jgi:hypothetical protein
MAENLIERGNHPAAIGFFRQAVIQHPDSVEAIRARGRLVAVGGAVPTPDEYDPKPEPVFEPPVKKARVAAAPAEVVNPPLMSVRSAPSSGSSGGSVHVRGYYRKDGTYVRPHTRRSPSR